MTSRSSSAYMRHLFQFRWRQQFPHAGAPWPPTASRCRLPDIEKLGNGGNQLRRSKRLGQKDARRGGPRLSEAAIRRETFYKALRKDGDPKLGTILKILSSLG